MSTIITSTLGLASSLGSMCYPSAPPCRPTPTLWTVLLSINFRPRLPRQAINSVSMDCSQGLLVVVDGGKGLRSAIKTVLGGHALVQRCQWHKREDVVSYLAREEQPWMRKRLQSAYERPTYDEALKALTKIRTELETRNQSALGSMDEGFEDTLTLHRLGVFAQLGRSFKTTNCLESINAMLEERCAKIDHWKNSDQRRRWLATALLDIEARLHRVLGYRYLPALREALLKELNLIKQAKSA